MEDVCCGHKRYSEGGVEVDPDSLRVLCPFWDIKGNVNFKVQYNDKAAYFNTSH